MVILYHIANRFQVDFAQSFESFVRASILRVSRDDDAAILNLDETRRLLLPALNPLTSLQLQLTSPNHVCRVAVPKVNRLRVTHTISPCA
tara:strand:- start:154 stop:423 length:270 start_codon:yes stop_codon:yes gene_type:complete